MILRACQFARQPIKIMLMIRRYSPSKLRWQQLLTIPLLCLTLLASSDLAAATVTAPASSPQRLQALLTYLQQDIFLTPGVGLKKVKIGQPIALVIQAWGQPLQQKSSGFVGRIQQWLYRGLGNTDIIVFSQSQRVTRLSFRARLVSPYQTVNGLQFGMQPVQVRSLLGVGQSDNGQRLAYPKKGLAVEFKEGRVQIISIFAPNS